MQTHPFCFTVVCSPNGAFGEQDLSRGSKVHKFIVGKPVKGQLTVDFVSLLLMVSSLVCFRQHETLCF